jgi:HK97 family phage prohead protease
MPQPNKMSRGTMDVAVRGVDDHERTLTGWATTPRPDRLKDIIEPAGAIFANQLPLLWHHNAEKPVGWASFETPTEAGIRFRAKIKVAEDGALKTRCDEAWDCVRYKLVTAASIGFRSLASEPLQGGGVRYKSVEILELSLVSLPANMDAVIDSVRQYRPVKLMPAIKIIPAPRKVLAQVGSKTTRAVVHYRDLRDTRPASLVGADGKRHRLAAGGRRIRTLR